MTKYRWQLRAQYFYGANRYKFSYRSETGEETLHIDVDADGCFYIEPTSFPLTVFAK